MLNTELWFLLVAGYCLTILIEIPILCLGLSAKYSLRERVVSGVWLTAFTYPCVVLVFPAVLSLAGINSHSVYLLIAETYAPLAEILLFRYLQRQPVWRRPDRDAAVILLANLCSFLAGEAGLSKWLHELAQGLTR